MLKRVGLNVDTLGLLLNFVNALVVMQEEYMEHFSLQVLLPDAFELIFLISEVLLRFFGGLGAEHLLLALS